MIVIRQKSLIWGRPVMRQMKASQHEIFPKCTIEGLYKLLKVLNDIKSSVPTAAASDGFANKSELTRACGFGGREQTGKYLRLALGLRLIFDWKTPLYDEVDSAVDVRVFTIDESGKRLLKLLESYDESKAIHKRAIHFYEGRRVRISPYPPGHIEHERGVSRIKMVHHGKR